MLPKTQLLHLRYTVCVILVQPKKLTSSAVSGRGDRGVLGLQQPEQAQDSWCVSGACPPAQLAVREEPEGGSSLPIPGT